MDRENRLTNVAEWLETNRGKLFRYWVYRRMFTPFEEEQKFSDESDFECSSATFGYIKEIIELPDKDLLIGFLHDMRYIPEEDMFEYVSYYKLSEIRLEYCSLDVECDEFREENDDMEGSNDG